jgi:hypothetical protein
MISIIKRKNIVKGKMFFNPAPPIKLYIIGSALLPIEERLGFCNYFVRIIMWIIKITLEINLVKHNP